MQTHFGPDFFTANRDRLRKLVGDDIPIVMTANGVMQRGADEPSLFHQDSSFWYLTGLSVADVILVMNRSETYLIVPGLTSTQTVFDGAHDVAAYMTRSGITTVLSEKDGWQAVRTLVQSGQVATLASPPSHIRRQGLYTLPFRRRLVAKLKRYNPNLQLHDIRTKLAAQRCIKQPEELLALQQAIDITSLTLQNIVNTDTLPGYQHEYEIEAALSFGFRKRGATGHAFAPIVGAGQHSTTLHYLKNDGPIIDDDVIVLDVGAEVEHYAADITRTISKQPLTGRRAEVFKAVADVQDFALSMLRPGVLPMEYETAVEAHMGTVLQKLKLISVSNREAIRHYFPHSTSHFLGLDTHDVGDYRSPWQENMVVTCEPGIYIPEEGIGVRIEDDVHILRGGNRVLSNTCPRELTPVQ